MPSVNHGNFPRSYAATQRFTLGVPRGFRVTDDGSHVVFLRTPNGTDPAHRLECIDAATGAVRVLLDPANLGSVEDLPPEEQARRERAREGGAGIVSFDLVGATAVATIGEQVALIDVPSGDQRFVNVAHGAFDPRLSPDGRHLAYVAAGALRLLDLGTDEDVVWAADPDADVSWATADFIAAEEIGRSRGFWWQTDSAGVFATRVDESGVEKWWIADPADPAATPRSVRYPAAGTTNALTELWWLPKPGTGEAQKIDWNDGGAWEYLAGVHPGPSRTVIVRQSRDQTRLQVVQVEVGRSKVGELLRELADTEWVEPQQGVPCDHSGGLYTIERSGERMSLLRDGSEISPGTDVVGLVGFVDDEAIVRARTSPRAIDVVALGSSNGDTRTIASGGIASAAVGGGTVVTAVSLAEHPRTATTVRFANGSTAAIEDLSEQPPLVAKPEFIRFESEVGELSAALFLPGDHDGQTPLPVLLDPYGGPHGQRVVDANRSHLASQWFADQGFAVLVADGRGTPGNGATIERAVRGDLATGVLADQIEALDSAARSHPFLDLDRVGIRGWSFGGYLAALAVMDRPDRVHCAIAGAPVTDWRLYDTHYTERYLGHPNTEPENYQRTTLIDRAATLGRPLMLIHGFSDDNVVVAHTLQLSGALLAAGRAHEVLPLARVSHMTPQLDVAENLLVLQRDFLIKHLRSA